MSRRRSLETILQSELVTVSELVLLSGMRYSTLKYYTEIGLLPFIQYDEGLVRRYPRLEALERLEQIRSLKDGGLTIQQIIDHFHSDRSKEKQ